MELQTYTTLKTTLQANYDVTDERFVTADELVGYFNEAIKNAEGFIHTLHHEDKYFLAPTTLTLVNGTRDYALPTNIYGNKIRNLFYENGSTKYEIYRVKDLKRIPFFEAGDRYEYIIINEEATGAPRIRLFPTPAEAGVYGTLWYIRNVKKMTTSVAATNVCELPESQNFVIAHARWNIAMKLKNPMLIEAEKEYRDEQLMLMQNALRDMVPDEDNQVPIDYSSYEDQGQGSY